MTFQENHPVMYEELRAIHAAPDGKNDFLVSLAAQLMRKGTLSEKQIAAWYRGKERNKTVAVDLSRVWDMFNTALNSGYKKPIYRGEGLKISKAPMTGRNPGALYVTRLDDNLYLGKVVDGKYTGRSDGQEALAVIAADPRAAAIRYGQRTGTCSCCGRQLTNHNSIDLGIGPICAARWGIA